MSAKQFNEMVNFQSGVLSVSETSSDMWELLERETKDVKGSRGCGAVLLLGKKSALASR